MRIPAAGDRLPWRGDGSARPAGIPLPPARMARVRSGRPLKSWRYVGVFGADLMLCAAHASVGGLPQRFWAVWDRGARELRESTRMRGGALALPQSAVVVRDRDVTIEIVLEAAGEAVEVVSRHGRSYIWTRKRPARARGIVRAGERAVQVDAPAIIDDSAGYHARRTAWDWSAGAGRTVDGRAVVWNLVAGMHDAPDASERTVWLDGAATEAAPVTFSDALDAVGRLRFTAEAQRARRDRLLLVDSEYRQPFGRFRGELPGGVRLDEGFGVMERHRARW
jgi:Protein of unknown function (DUF2804)